MAEDFGPRNFGFLNFVSDDVHFLGSEEGCPLPLNEKETLASLREVDRALAVAQVTSKHHVVGAIQRSYS